MVTAGDQVGKAVDALPAVVSKAADEATDKDNIDKVGDAMKDTGQAASSALSKTGKATSSAVSETSADVKAAADSRQGPGQKGQVMKGILLWLVGVPIPVIILLYLFGVMR